MQALEMPEMPDMPNDAAASNATARPSDATARPSDATARPSDAATARPSDAATAWPSDAATRSRAVARATRPIAPEVLRVLLAQNAGLAPSPARDANLAALGRGAAAVVTGQQVGLFLGPLYTIYKAASAIVVARTLAAETGMAVVPVFWLQTEDHDLPEISTCGVPAAARCEQVSAPIESDNRVSIAHRTLPAEIAGCLERLRDTLGEGPLAQAHLARLGRHYRAGVPWAQAFAGVLAELFAPEGLIVIDPREPTLAALAAPIHARALDDAEPIAAAMIARCDELASAGQAIPIHVRPGAPLSFFHPDGALGPRVRLEPAGEGFAEVGSGTRHSRVELDAALRDDPRRFSTSALLRPILQDTLLPTVAYVGGPSEVAYFAQLGPLYRAFGMTMPFAVPRARFRIVDPRTQKLLARLGLTARDAELSEEALLARLRPRDADAEVTHRLLEPFVAAHAALAAELADHPDIARALAKTRGSVERSVGKLARKVERTRLYADAERVDAVRRLRAMLAPDGAPQERVLGLAGLAARLGDREVIARVLAAIDPFDATLQELT